MSESSARPGISCVICAYNEAPRLPAVLSAVVGHPGLDEIIVVDDGSVDDTARVAGAFTSVRVLRHERNRGKSAAMATGVGACRHEWLLLLDADLQGLNAGHVSALLAPVRAGHADLSLSLRGNSLAVFRAIGMDFVSGERVLRRDLLAGLLHDLDRLPRFGIEVYMNRLIIAQRLRLAVIDWREVAQTRKTDKLGWRAGLRAEVRMVRDLLRVAGPLELLAQSWRLRGLHLRQAIGD